MASKNGTGKNSKKNKTPKSVDLNLDVFEINQILATLSEQPYKSVCNLIQKITIQGELQLDKDKNVKPEKKDATTPSTTSS